MCTVFSNVPNDWAVCFMHDCILKEQCLRHHAGKSLPVNQHSALTVLPSARTGDSCQEFHAMKTERLAWGFSHLFDDVKRRDYRPPHRTRKIVPAAVLSIIVSIVASASRAESCCDGAAGSFKNHGYPPVFMKATN